MTGPWEAADGGWALARGPATAAASAPRASVIVPVRNDAARLVRCLEALRCSTVRDLEVIVADDASTDDTAQVAERMGVRVVRLARNGGPAEARDVAATVARGEILVFIDADVCVHPDTVEAALASFGDAGVDAVFGSYDLEPAEPNLLSQYKNLAHRFYHQTAREKATTFWSGCGAIRRDVFLEFGGFDAQRFGRPSIEDVDLGVRLTRAGRRILINKRMQAKHLKRWTLSGIVRSDVLDRGIPWTRLILREKDLPNDLNLSASQRIAALLTAGMAGLFLLACWYRPWLAVVPPVVFGGIALADRWAVRGPASRSMRLSAGAAMAAGVTAGAWYAGWWALALLLPVLPIVLINRSFYRFFLGHRGLLFTAGAVLPMHLLYYLYSLLAFACGVVAHWRDGGRIAAAAEGEGMRHAGVTPG